MSKADTKSSKAPEKETPKEKKETLEDIYRKDAATDKKDAEYEAQLLDLLKRKEEPTQTLREKMEGTKAFARILAEPKNHETAKVFLLTSFALFTLPFIVFFLSVFFIEPMVGSSDPDTFNALAAIGTTMSVVVAYVVYAFKTDALTENDKLDYPQLSGLQGKKKGPAVNTAVPPSKSGSSKKNKKD